MKNYKIEIVQTETFVVDVEAETEDEARHLATGQWNAIAEAGTHHYYQSGDTETVIGSVYDVTGTDDA